MPRHAGPGSQQQARVRLGRQPRRYGEQKIQDDNGEYQTSFHSAHEVALRTVLPGHAVQIALRPISTVLCTGFRKAIVKPAAISGFAAGI